MARPIKRHSSEVQITVNKNQAFQVLKQALEPLGNEMLSQYIIDMTDSDSTYIGKLLKAIYGYTDTTHTKYPAKSIIRVAKNSLETYYWADEMDEKLDKDKCLDAEVISYNSFNEKYKVSYTFIHRDKKELRYCETYISQYSVQGLKENLDQLLAECEKK